MRLILPYNEILPTKKAHDLYLFNLCHQLSTKMEVELLCGRGSLDKESLFSHYGESNSSLFSLCLLPIIRKNNPFGISWNYLFFSKSQKYLEKSRERKGIVHLSVLKQGLFHLKRKIPGYTYIFEAHELSFYGEGNLPKKKLKIEKEVFQRADLIIVTTEQLKEILRKPPYLVKNQIEVIPLAAKQNALPPSCNASPLTLGYVGQLYQGQGIDLLLSAAVKAPLWHLKIIGGNPKDITKYQKMAESFGIQKRVQFCGFCPPENIPKLAASCHAFIAPFENSGRMPFVAHTKLGEYALMGRPIIAPDLPIVREYFPLQKGVLLFTPDNAQSLAETLIKLSDSSTRQKLQSEIEGYKQKFSPANRTLRYLQLFL